VVRARGSQMRLKHGLDPLFAIRYSCGKGAGFSDEIETPLERITHAGHHRGKGAGFSDEIETSISLITSSSCNKVVRARGSQMRLKLYKNIAVIIHNPSGKGAGFSDEIETGYCLVPCPTCTGW